jgi:antitoxin YefM
VIEKYILKMNILSYSEARANLKKTMDEVCEDHSPTVITRQGGESVVLISLADYESMEETLYLLGSANNARRLLSSIAQVKAGKAKIRELINDGETTEEDTEQTQS